MTDDDGKMICEDCGDSFEESEGRPAKYEPEAWICERCHDNRMKEND